MPTLRKKGQHFYALFYDPDRRPKQKSITLRTKNRSAALRRLATLEADYAAGRFDPWSDPAPETGLALDQAIARFLDQPGRRPKTIAGYRDVLGRFAASLPPGVALAAVTADHVATFLDRPALAPASRQSYFRHLRAFFRWCGKQALLKLNPAERVTPPAAGRREAPFFSPKALQALVDSIETAGERWLADVVRVAVSTGLRRGELVHLRWRDVDLDAGFLVVRNREDFRSKSGHDRRVPLVEDALDVVSRLADERGAAREGYVFRGTQGGKLNADSLSKAFLRSCRRAHVPEGLHFHSLRHTAASWLVMRGVPMSVVQAILGHADLATTQRYSHLAPATLRDEMARALREVGVRQGTSR